MIHIIKRTTLRFCILLLNISAIHAAPFVYVANGASPNGAPGPDTTVYAIDVATDAVVAIIDIGANTCYSAVAITPDAKTVLVGANDGGQGLVARIDVATNTHLLPDITLSGSPRSIAITPNGLYAYVTCTDNTVNKINLTTNTVDATISSSSINSPFEITVAPNGLTVYVNSVVNDLIVPIKVSDNTIGTPATASTTAHWLAITPDNKYLYVSNINNTGIEQYDLSDPLAPTDTGVFINLSSSNYGLAMTADGKTLYATLYDNNTVVPIDLSNPSSPVIHPAVSVGSTGPWVIAIAPNGTSAYISNNQSTSPGIVTELDITNRLTPTIKATINIGAQPAGLAITPPLAPTSLRGCKTRNTFLLQTDYINNLTWNAPENSLPIAYNIYRDAALLELAGTVLVSGPLQFYDHHRNPNSTYTYYITSLGGGGNQSIAANITVTNPC